MSTSKFNHDDNFNLHIQRAINNQDCSKIRALIGNALRRQKYIDLTSELSQAVTLGNKDLVELIYPYYRRSPKLIPKIALTKQDQKYLGCIIFLLDNGFTIVSKDPDMQAYMHSLIINKHDLVFMKLMNHNINANLRDERTGYSLIHTACLAHRMRIVKFLIKRKADVNAKVIENNGSITSLKNEKFVGKTVLFIAVDIVNIPMIKVLLKNGANPNDSWEILASAIEGNHQEIIRLLLDYGADINITDSCGKTPLYLCISKFSKLVDAVRSEIVTMLLDNGADVNARTMTGGTPLFIATEYANVKILKVLINYNANIFVTKHGNNIIHITLGLNNNQVLEMLSKVIPSENYKKLINVKNYQGQTPLHIGIKIANIKGIQTLLKNDADINSMNNYGKAPLHIAIETANLVITEVLLAANPNINIKDRNGQTPLHYAAKIYQKGILFIQKLIDHGAHINSMDNDDRVPLHFACSIKNTQVVYNLVNNGAQVNVKDKFEQTALHWACKTNFKLTENVKILDFLVENYANINCIDSTGNSPLHYAVANSSMVTTELLLKAGADINFINIKNETAVDYVSKNMMSIFRSESENDKIAQYLRKHIIQLIVANLYVCEQNINLAYNVEHNDANVKWIKCYENSCEKELSRMKQKKIGGSDITYYNVLMGDLNYKVNFTLSEETILNLMSGELDDNFPLYADILKFRLKVARLRRKLYHQIREYTNSTKFKTLPDNCFNKIFYYFDIGELKAFVDAIKPGPEMLENRE